MAQEVALTPVLLERARVERQELREQLRALAELLEVCPEPGLYEDLDVLLDRYADANLRVTMLRHPEAFHLEV